LARSLEKKDLSVSNSYKGYLHLFTFIYIKGLVYTLVN